MKDQGQPLLRETRPGLQRLRIDVDDRREPAPPKLGARRDEERCGAACECPRLSGFRDELRTVTAPQAQERRRAENRALDSLEADPHLAQHLGDARRIRPRRDDRDEVTDRRVAECRATLELLGEEPDHVVPLRELERHRVGLKRLDEHESRCIAALRPASCVTS